MDLLSVMQAVVNTTITPAGTVKDPKVRRGDGVGGVVVRAVVDLAKSPTDGAWAAGHRG